MANLAGLDAPVTPRPAFWPTECDEPDCSYVPKGFVKDEHEQTDGSIRVVVRHYCSLHMRPPQRYRPDGEPIGKAKLHQPTPAQIQEFDLETHA